MGKSEKLNQYYGKIGAYIICNLHLNNNIDSESPDIELLSQKASFSVSSSLQRLTAKFGMELEWVHCAINIKT